MTYEVVRSVLLATLLVACADTSKPSPAASTDGGRAQNAGQVICPAYPARFCRARAR